MFFNKDGVGCERHCLSVLARFLLMVLISSAANSDTDALLFKNVRLFDGYTLTSSTDVLIQHGLIQAVGPSLEAPTHAQRIHGGGLTLLPGLIDAHTHVTDALGLREALSFGVTTELDMAADPTVIKQLRNTVNETPSYMASVKTAGFPVTAAGGHGTQYRLNSPTVETADELPQWIDARIQEGSDFIKIMYEHERTGLFSPQAISKEALHNAVAAAQGRGLVAVVHTTSIADTVDAVASGADGLAHIPFRGLVTSDMAGAIKKREMFVITTLSVFQGLCDGEYTAALADNKTMRSSLAAVSVDNLRGLWWLPNLFRPDCDVVRESVENLIQAGVSLIAGTDSPNPGTAHGASLQAELQLMVMLGVSHLEVLRSATSRPSEAFGLHDRGVIAAGRRADLLLVRGDPSEDIQDLLAIEGVWKQGRRLDVVGYQQFLTTVKE